MMNSVRTRLVVRTSRSAVGQPTRSSTALTMYDASRFRKTPFASVRIASVSPAPCGPMALNVWSTAMPKRSLPVSVTVSRSRPSRTLSMTPSKDRTRFVPRSPYHW